MDSRIGWKGRCNEDGVLMGRDYLESRVEAHAAADKDDELSVQEVQQVQAGEQNSSVHHFP